MRTIIAGSRTFLDAAFLESALEQIPWQITEVVSGGARGPDALGALWAHHRDVPVKRFPADWDTFGRAAGPLRNAQMADYAEALVAFWDGHSRGTKNMIWLAEQRGLKVVVVRIPGTQATQKNETPETSEGL